MNEETIIRTAVVTGGSRGIGRAVCVQLARQGCHVVVNYCHGEAAAAETVSLCRAEGAQAVAVQADVSTAEGCKKLFEEAVNAFGRVDILVNNAGITRDNLILRMSEADFDAVLDANLKGAFLCCKEAARRMVRQRWGRIVNLSSVVALRGNAGQTNYAASKAGLIGLTKSLARELASRNVTVNAVAPGFIETDMTAALPEAVRTEMAKDIPAGRAGQPEDVANAVAFFAAEQSSYLTGQVLCVDGGMAMLKEKFSMEKRRVVITGLGTVNPLGNTAADSWAAAKAGRCGIGPITQFDTTDFKCKLAGEVKNFDPETVVDKKEARKMARFTLLALAAAAEAIADSGLNTEAEAKNIGVVLSSGIGGLPTIEEQHTRGEEKGMEKVSPYFVPMSIANMAAAQVAIRFGLKGMCTCPVTACAGGTNAVGDAFHRIRDGYETAMVCGGAESCISPLGIGGFTSMKALSTATDPDAASLPFDARRGGFVMGEGSGVLVLEELEHARARGAHIYAEVVGYGANCDAYHFTAPAPGGTGAIDCMKLTLADAGIAPEQVDHINAHGTGTHMNDACETAAIHAVFGEHAKQLTVVSTKSMTGHLLGGAGGIEAVFTALALRDQFAPPTIHYEQPDPECDLDYVPNAGRAQAMTYALSNSLGFGGHNACIALRRWEG